ncbi:MAG: hypothetical protein ACUVS2_14015, partial [Candidatus Flexifilum sp.]
MTADRSAPIAAGQPSAAIGRHRGRGRSRPPVSGRRALRIGRSTLRPYEHAPVKAYGLPSWLVAVTVNVPPTDE